jgi:hypothetical protein
VSSSIASLRLPGSPTAAALSILATQKTASMTSAQVGGHRELGQGWPAEETIVRQQNLSDVECDILCSVVVVRTKGDGQHHLSQGLGGARNGPSERASWSELLLGDL